MTDIPQPQVNSRLCGSWLTVVRVVWAIVALAALVIFLLSLPGYLLLLNEGLSAQAAPGFAAVVDVIGLLASLAAAAVSLALAGLLFWRRPDDKMALFLSFFFLVYGIVMAGPLERLHLTWPALVIDAELAQAAIFTAPFVALFGLFPNGRFVPGWMRWVTLASLGFIPLYYLLPCCDFSKVNLSLLGFLMLGWLAMLAAVVYAQVHRYRHVSSPAERQQTKWVIYGLVLFLLMDIVSTIPYIMGQRLPPDAPLPWWVPIGSLFWWSSLVVLPLTLAFSVLRYRLFEIDVIIKRTAQYALISGAGFVVYLLAVGGASLFIQSNTQLIAGAIVLALLVIFFNPARKRLQTVLDRLIPYTPPPPDVLAELEREKAEREQKKIEKAAQKPPAAEGARLSGAWLALARAGWLAFFAFATLSLLFAIPARWAQLAQPTPATLANLNALAWPVMGYAVYSLATELLFTAVFLGVGLLIFARRSDDGMALFMSLTLVAYGVGNQTITPTINALLQYPLGKSIYPFFTFAAWATFSVFPYLFPNGRFVPRWAHIPALIWFLLCIPWNFLPPDSPWGVFNWPPVIFVPMLLFLWVSWVACQVYRYARVSTPVERQQTKWVVYALAMIVANLIVMFVGALVFGRFEVIKLLAVGEPATPQDFVFIAAFQAMARLGGILLPFAFAFSIFRYRLWDIDLVIKRTVQYALISGAGLGVYLLAVGGTSLFIQSNTQLIAGVIVLALLVVFFHPARKRLQAVLDKLMPYIPPPPEVLAEMERERAEKEQKRKEKMETQTDADSMRLRGGWLTLARATWIVLSAIAIIAFIAEAAIIWTVPFPSCIDAAANCGPWQVTREDIALAAQLGFSSTFLVGAYFGINLLSRLSFAVVGLIIFWRKSDDLIALLLSFMLVGFLTEGVQHLGAFMPAIALLYGLSTVVFLLLPFIFPSGTFAPRWTGWVFWPLAVFSLPPSLLPLISIKLDEALFSSWLLSVFGLWFLVAGYAAVYRYRRISNTVERQQTKWVMLGIFGTCIVFIPFIIITFVFPPNQPSAARLAFIFLALIPIGTAAYLFFSAAIAVAVFRYRLYNIDIVIRRTVQYAAISALGFGVYLLAVGGTSLFLQSRNNLLAGGLALGAVAAAFVWLRPRLEAWMNRAMPLPARPPEAAPLSSAPAPRLESSRPLSNFWQRLVRMGWMLLALNSLWAVGWTLFYTWELAQAPPPRIAEGLTALTLSRDVYFWANALPIALIFLSHFGMAAALFWRRPHDRMALFVAVFMMAFGVANAYPLAPEFLQVWETGRLYYVIPFLIDNLLGWPLLVAFFALYPDGVFVPGWMRYLAVYGVLISIVWSLFPQAFGEPQGLMALFVYGSVIAIFGGSLYAQIHRYRRHATPLQRQQIKWMVYGIALYTAVIVVQVTTALLNPTPTPAESVQRELIFMPLNLVSALLPIALGLAIMRYRLFEIEVILRRTAIYGAVVGGAALVYFGGVALLQWLSLALTGPQSNFVVVLITLGIVALFNPVRRRFQIFIDRAFYREKVDFREAFTAFAREIRTIIDLQELLRALVNRTTELLHITHGAVYLSEAASTDGTEGIERRFGLAEGKNLPEGLDRLTLEAAMLERLWGGQAVSRLGHDAFPLLVPLIAPVQSPDRPLTQSLIGVLALGPRLSEQAYSQEDQTLLTGLADQAGTAVYVAQLIQEKQAEAGRIEDAERRLDAYRNSPAGRAETTASALIAHPALAFSELHALTQQAGSDPAVAALLEPLPAALTAQSALWLAGAADGYRYLFAGQSAPELLPVGLRTLTEALTLLDAEPARQLYLLCQRALESNSIPAIVERGAEIRELPPDNSALGQTLSGLRRGLLELAAAADGLRAYERVDAPQDKLAYLVSAVERLSHADRLARAELGAADRGLVQRIAGNWLAVVTGAMSELQTRARLVCRLLTRHTWTGEVVSLALGLRNEGRGAALNIKVSLAPAPEYTVLDEIASVERLASGEEAQVELRVRPRLAEGTGAGQFRARFVVLYDDPRGPDQAENFADVVYLLAGEGEFQFIPNPYVVGTPLQTGSSLFFGREDVFGFIQENLAAAHQNNLVLIGQRRTGKTSLLKQLPARLGDRYVPVYLDGQSLALDPGLPNFFYSLATEIAFALEDRGLATGDLPDFADSPATTFERKFLAQVRSAIGGRHLLLLLDEFEELEGAVRRGNLDVSVFGFLRHLIQHSENLSVIFCGTHRMEELAADYWSVLFNISLYRHVAFLQQAEAFRLVQEPVTAFGMKYDDLALDKMWRVTAGHPYFLQLLCHSLVNQHNRSQRNYVTVADVNAALDEILASGEAHFVYLWTESTQAERLALTALSRMMPLTGQANAVQVRDYLEERGVPLDRRAVSEALHHLVLRDILRFNRNEGDSIAADADAYRWQLGLLGLWVEKYKSLSRVVDEVK